MFLPIPQLSLYWQRLNILYGNTILSISDKWLNDEAIRGRSCKQYKVNQYYYAFYLGLLIKTELLHGYTTDKDYYYTKYNLVDLKNKLACNNISLTDILNIFDISFTESTGIEGISIEDGFIVEPDYTLPTTVYNIQVLLANPTYCTTIYTNCI
jgi:hypothetical protein